jgi:hypothetical protein
MEANAVDDLIVDPNSIPNKNQEDSYQLLRRLGIPVTRHLIKHAILRRELKPVRLGNGNFFSTNDLLAWVESRRQEGTYSVANPSAASES